MRLERQAEISSNFDFIGITVGIHWRAFGRGLTRSNSDFEKIPLTARRLYQVILLVEFTQASLLIPRVPGRGFNMEQSVEWELPSCYLPCGPSSWNELAWAGQLPRGGMTPREPQSPSSTGVDRDDSCVPWTSGRLPGWTLSQAVRWRKCLLPPAHQVSFFWSFWICFQLSSPKSCHASVPESCGAPYCLQIKIRLLTLSWSPLWPHCTVSSLRTHLCIPGISCRAWPQ